MNRMKSKILLLGGLLLIAAALLLTLHNIEEAKSAAVASKNALKEIQNTTLAQSKEPKPQVPDYVMNPEMDMPTVEASGNNYIGVLEIPDLDLTLPILSEWSYPNLKIAPCRYQGSVYLDTLILAAHNYPYHFGKINELENGSPIHFIDAQSNSFSYQVVEISELNSSAVEEMTSGDWDLTLFTCTINGWTRITVRCERIEKEPSQESIDISEIIND